MDIGNVPGEIGILQEYQGVTGTLPGVIGPSWAIREKRRGGKRWAAPPPPCPIQTPLGEDARHPLRAPLSLPSGPCRPIKAPGGSGNPRYSGKIPISPGTLPTCKYRLPIYQSSCLDHFETPRHVRDHIRDSEQPSVHQNA